MPLPWYIKTLASILISPLMLLYPMILVMESFRGALLSATSIGLFIELPSAPPTSTLRDMATMQLFLTDFKKILDAIPVNLRPLFGPWFDYYDACYTFLKILEMLMEVYDLPETCPEAWERQRQLEETETTT